MFDGMDIVHESLPFADRPRSVSRSDPGPRGQNPHKRDHCISKLTGVSSCKKKLSKRPGYMRKDVEQRLNHPPLVDVQFVSPQVENERITCSNLPFNNNKLVECLNNLKHLRDVKTADQSTVSNHVAAENPVVAASRSNMMSENIQSSDSTCRWTDDCNDSCNTRIKTCFKCFSSGSLQKQDACLTQSGRDNSNAVNKPQVIASPKKQVDNENFQKLQLWNTDEEICSTNAFISSFSFIQMSLNYRSINANSKDELQQNGFVSNLQFPQAQPHLSLYQVSTLATKQFYSKPLRDTVEPPCPCLSQSVDIKCAINTESKGSSQNYDSLLLDVDFPFLRSVDYSDDSSNSSVTSGYESNITAFDQNCYSFLRKYEQILQDCLLENRMIFKHQSLILKLKKLQKKAVWEDDYEKADQFNKKLAELKRENSLKFQLPSSHPCIARFVQEIELQEQVAEHYNNPGNLLQSVEERFSDSTPHNLHMSWSRKKQLIQDRQQLQIFTSQRLCSKLSEKASDIEMQLPILLEAKMLAISGHEFSTAKALAEEFKYLNSKKIELEELINDLQDFSIKKAQQLETIREEYNSLRAQLDQREGLFEKNLKENIFAYMKVLDDKLYSCGNQLLEKVWEADFKACQLFFKSLQLQEENFCGPERQEFQPNEDSNAVEDACIEVKDKDESTFLSKQDWCSVPDQKETDLSKVLTKCSFSIKDTQSEITFKSSAVDIGVQCETISHKLVYLEDQLQMAMNNHDKSLTQHLQREVQMVKETLQAMLKQLLPDEDEKELGDFIINSW
ncbi:disrupted in schizophrenia 1 protein isoform X3 [Chiloscyllium plagiosum]|uniref:disrupted in schizophrenia 1 protein isoform X3 n=1 Tax=Chiloscyllium plagiosum TaxID=36176 RepID=UPI001CB865E6|nr:disrupted in schizophrenia 1 protein isoform X3 [Chiloscyllium plagiosum]